MLAVLYVMPPRSVHAALVPPAELAPFAADKSPTAVAAVSFVDFQGKPVLLSAFRGRYVLLNLWAPWCAPCVRELPSLAKLRAAIPPEHFEIVAVDVGRDTVADARSFLDAHDAKQLSTYLDTKLALLRTFGAYGLPLTVLIDPQGREIGRALGPAAWDAPQAIDYFRALTAPRAAS